jgi:lysophospholipase L1-like esterase
LCFIEISLGLGTTVLVNAHVLRNSLLPKNLRLSDDTWDDYKFHPLLQIVPKPNVLRLSPFRIQHDSYGLRGVERDKNRLRQQIVIAAVGGSTTYDLGVANGQTWPEVLERTLGDKYAVLNHGVIGYSTVENLIQTLFYLNSYDVKPHCAVYYEGWNDIHNAYFPNLDPAYTNWHLLVQTGRLRKINPLKKITPLGQFILWYLQQWIEIIPKAEDLFGHAAGRGNDVRLEKIYRANLEAIAAINKQRGITTIFVAQVLNRAKLRGTTVGESWWALVRPIDAWPLQAHFNSILKETAKDLGIPAFVPPIDEFQDRDFVDSGHFSQEGAAKFAAMLEPVVRANCK